MSLFTVPHHISSAMGVPKIWYFAWKLRVVLGKKDTWFTIRCLFILSLAPINIPIHLKKALKYSNSNGYCSLQRTTTFPMLRGCPNLIIFMKIEGCFGRNDTWLTIRCLFMLSEATVNIPINLMRVMKHSSSNGCLSLQYTITFPMLRGCPKSDNFNEN